uniref:Uncharacterized protein n=1 Tax=Craspedostauros australis TaxID=1486917 RepID=A0A7R9ZLG4_9STRA|mmetsp:Transcript_17187/g.47587  ORF Transcript_17187/g.47587 Transcript_17187/m.47587 type:complete len:414 (+) Transcript_17187:318-1559(+)
MAKVEEAETRKPLQTRPKLKWLVEDGALTSNWSLVQERIESNPEEVKHVDALTGRTVLHQLCSVSYAPTKLLELVASLFPEATRVQENTYKATPLHIRCYTSQRSVKKVETILKYMTEDDVLLKNLFGGTVLHSACNSNADINVLKMLIAKNPRILLQKTHEYSHTAMTALWQSYLQSIPGIMAIANILNGREVHTNLFDRFWEKVELLACESYKLSPAYPGDVTNASPSICNTNTADADADAEATNDTTAGDGEEVALDTRYLLHGMLFLRVDMKLAKVALRLNPSWARHADKNGDYVIHKIIKTLPFPNKNSEMIRDVLKCYPEAAGKANLDGDLPLFLAIRDKLSWWNGVEEIVKAYPDALAMQDRVTGLFPSLLAAANGGKVAIDTTYELLCAKPDLIKDAHDFTQNMR